MDQTGLIIGLVICGYLLGAVPFGVVISKTMRAVGSSHGREQERWIYERLARVGQEGWNPDLDRRYGQGMGNGLRGDAGITG